MAKGIRLPCDQLHRVKSDAVTCPALKRSFTLEF